MTCLLLPRTDEDCLSELYLSGGRVLIPSILSLTRFWENAGVAGRIAASALARKLHLPSLI